MEFCSRAISNDHNGEVVSRDDYLNPIDKLGEAGKITNTYVRKDSKPVKSHKEKEAEKLKDMQYKVFDNQTDAIDHAKKELNKTLYLRKDNTPTKDTCTDKGEHLTIDELIAKLGKLIMPKVPIRLIPVKDSNDNIKWFLVWKTVGEEPKKQSNDVVESDSDSDNFDSCDNASDTNNDDE
jgi:hypothetical protein